MKIYTMVLFCLLILAGLAWTVGQGDCAQAQMATPAASQPGPPAALGRAPARKPQYIKVHLHTPDRALVAGESGSLELTAEIENPQGSPYRDLVWDTRARAPLMVWISTQRDSGISFIDKANPDRPHHHILVKFDKPAADTAQPLSQNIEYTVAPRTKTGQHNFWLEVFGELTAQGSPRIYDAGISTLPFDVDTHLYTKLLMLAVVAVAVFLFIVEWVRVDVVAMAMMVLLPELGLLNAQDTFRGLSSNAVVAIIGVMIISYGLNRAGVVHRMMQPILGFVSKSSSRLVVTFSSLIAGISGVMQNTGAAVLFLPAIRSVTASKLKIPLARVLMPIGMAAILGGTLTMIGTSPLILLNDILPPGMPKFGLLELTPIGLALAIGGILYLSTLGMRFLAQTAARLPSGQAGEDNAGGDGPLDAYPLLRGPYEIVVPADYIPGDLPQEVVNIRRRFMVNIVAVARDDGACTVAPLPGSSIQAGLILCAYGPEKDVRDFVHTYGLEIREKPVCYKDTMFNRSLAGVVEGVVSPRSSLIGRTIKEIRFRETFGVNPMAIHQDGDIYYQDMADRPLQSGDTILMHGTWEQFKVLQEMHQNFIIITPFEQEYHKPEKARSALICFLGSLVLMLISSFYFQNLPYNPIPLSICLMLGAVGMIVTKVVTISEAYHAVDWRTVFLLGGLIPLGMAVDQTGTAQWIATGLVSALGSLMSPLLLLAVLACLSCAFTLVISNVGACTLLVPLGISIANHIGIDPRVAAIVVGLGVSNSFILPTHQVNALYMGPGEYQTRDYIKIGGILSLIYIVVLVAMTYVFYL
jgi:di/tricarboxylate transporter